MLLKSVMGWAKNVILSLLMMCPLIGIVHIVGGLIFAINIIVVSGSMGCFFSSAVDGPDIMSNLFLMYLFKC